MLKEENLQRSTSSFLHSPICSLEKIKFIKPKITKNSVSRSWSLLFTIWIRGGGKPKEKSKFKKIIIFKNFLLKQIFLCNITRFTLLLFNNEYHTSIVRQYRYRNYFLVYFIFPTLRNSPDPDPHLSMGIRIRAAFLNADPDLDLQTTI